jgi:DNA-binding transcriptional LysR family regulator
MDLKHARTFVTVADLGTVSKAAQRLHVAQPALSRRIGALEHELGIKLFDRVGRRLALTGAGMQLLADCRTLVGCATAVAERARQLQRGDSGVLRVAASPQIIEGAIAEFLRRYAQRYPDVAVKLLEVIGWPDVVGMLERGDVDLVVNLRGALQPDDRRFASHALEAVDLLAACRPAVDLGDDGKIDIARLMPYPLLLLDSSYVFRRNFDAACRLAGLAPNVAFESRTPHTLLAMAESGHGVAIVPAVLRMAHRRLRIAAVTYRGKCLRVISTIYWDPRRTLPAYASAFCEQLGAHMREVFPISRPTKIARAARARPRARTR